MRVIPAIDIFDGKCVRLREGDFSTRRVYEEDPLTAAMRFAEAGARWLHVVDLEGAKEGRVVNWSKLSAIMSLDKIAVQVGGGVRTMDDVSRLVALGARRIIVGSVAIRAPALFEEWLNRFGSERFCIAVDVMDGSLVSEGWQSKAETPLVDVVTKMEALGVKPFLCTDVMRDGTMRGPNIALYETLVRQFPSLEWIASGGVRTKDDLTALEKTNVTAVVVGKALYEGTVGMDELARLAC
ncbi:MAG TPA: 1-(5-phosphoribosyl)-5-[(5-phosphoribosylamino)methylideneamino]imidazole-4-carboxamide isomerase [Blastocatellia bacterium]|nr:1-(5-phosphoribosyl)-5-[(5-phosphoribosylamino)methylideneamino]imidazole-4-carboxamide isomerase [Blastocatellia bacterium]